jgi:hypothetical protein
LTALAVVVSTAAEDRAWAGEYAVHACDPAYGDVNRTWVAQSSHGGMTSYTRCPAGGPVAPAWDQGLVTRHVGVGGNPNATVPAGVWSALAFYAPAGASLSRITFQHQFCSQYGYSAGLRGPAHTPVFTYASGWCDPFLPQPYSYGLGGISAVKVMTVCELASGCPVGQGLKGYASLRTAVVYVQDFSAPTVSFAASPITGPGWQRGTQSLLVVANDNVGVRSVQARSGARVLAGATRACDATLAVPCPNGGTWLNIATQSLADGRHSLTAWAADSAGNAAAQSRTLYVDNTAPAAPVGLAVDGGSGWRRANSYVVRWRDRPEAFAPIAGARWEICPGVNKPGDGRGCQSGLAKGASLTKATLAVPGPGEWSVRVWLLDAAGNADAKTASEVRLRFDDSPPEAAFQPHDPDEPRRLRVRAVDRLSGLRGGEIELRRQGDSSWHAPPVALEPGGITAVFDDEALPDGVYDVRARVVDAAGNERTTDRLVNGDKMRLTLPVRGGTQLAVGVLDRRRRLVAPRLLKNGRVVGLRGRLTAAGGNPLAGTAISVAERVALPGAAWREVATVRTSARGAFSYRAPAGPSRALRFRYAGTPTIRGATRELALRVKATTSLRVSRSRVVNGEEVTFRGRIAGAPLAEPSKLVELQAYARGRWITFATPRADPRSGLWRHPYRFAATRGRVVYRFRARVPLQGGLPFETGVSRRVKVRVQGL